ncbi:MAG: hypothetical protein GVY30_00190 [Chloroflexi bacterium]|jgi:hypothetical protein|nr:hypothetical protein [Chloroflexota bacterium]
MVKRAAHGGMRHLGVYQLGDDGLPFVSAAGADPYSGLWMNMAQSFVPQWVDGQIIQFEGDDQSQGQIDLGPNEMSSIQIATSVNNLTVDALLANTSVFQLGGSDALGRETDRDNCLPTVMLLAYSQGIDREPDSLTFGNTIYRYYLVMQAMVRAMPGGHESGNPATTEYTAYPRKVEKILGFDFDVATHGFAEAAYIDGHMPGPPVLDAFLIDASPTLTLNLSETPYSETAYFQAFLVAAADGSGTDITSDATVDADAGTITFTTPVEDDQVFVLYAKSGGCS